MIKKEIIERLKTPNWVIDVNSNDQVRLVLWAARKSGIDIVNLAELIPDVVEANFPNLASENGELFYDYPPDLIKELGFINITEWFFHSIYLMVSSLDESENVGPQEPIKKTLTIPDGLWPYLQGDYVWMDRNHNLYISYVKPVFNLKYGGFEYKDTLTHQLKGLNINVHDIDWTTSLTIRPIMHE